MIGLLSSLSSKVYLVVIAFLVGILTILGLTLWFKNSKIEDLQSEITLEKTKHQQALSNNITLSREIEMQNATILHNKIDYDSKIKEFENWKKNFTKSKGVKSNECKDIKNILDGIRSNII